MTLFIDQFAQRAGDDLLTFMGDIHGWMRQNSRGCARRPLAG
jgi:hypothetical protein